jgi:serine/threonine protein kinase
MVARIGKGSYGSVYKVEDKKAENEEFRFLAIKKMRLTNKQLYEQGIHFTTLREVKILQELEHENIIKMIDIFYLKNTTFMAMELMHTDLWNIVANKDLVLMISHIK